MIPMRARPPGAAILLLIVSTWSCTRDNPAYRGPSIGSQSLEGGVSVEADAAVASTVGEDADLAADGGVDLADDGAAADLAGDGSPDKGPPGGALLIVGDLDLSRSDVQLEDALGRLGFALTLKLDTDSTTADASDKEVIIISGSTWPDDVSTKFVAVPVPVVVFDEAMFPTMKMTGPRQGQDFGLILNERSLDILDAEHPLAANLSGTVEVAAANILLSWGVPAPSAARVASEAGEHDRVTIFAYEAGDMMVGLRAPSRRVGSFVRYARNTTYTEAGLSLFEAAVLWATGRI
jgi:hypothetical protein